MLSGGRERARVLWGVFFQENVSREEACRTGQLGGQLFKFQELRQHLGPSAESSLVAEMGLLLK